MSVQDQFVEQMLGYIRDQEGIIRELIAIMQRCETSKNGLDKFINAVDQGLTSNEKLGQMLRTVCKVQKEQSAAIQQLAMGVLVYVRGGNFTTDAAHIACALGKGQEALKEMWKQKLKG